MKTLYQTGVRKSSVRDATRLSRKWSLLFLASAFLVRVGITRALLPHLATPGIVGDIVYTQSGHYVTNQEQFWKRKLAFVHLVRIDFEKFDKDQIIWPNKLVLICNITMRFYMYRGGLPDFYSNIPKRQKNEGRYTVWCIGTQDRKSHVNFEKVILYYLPRWFYEKLY